MACGWGLWRVVGVYGVWVGFMACCVGVPRAECQGRGVRGEVAKGEVPGAEPFGDTVTQHRMPPNTVACRPVAWRLKIGAGSTVRKSQVYIRLCQTIGITSAIDIAIVLPNPAICPSLSHSLGHSHGLVFLLGAPVCKATKSSVFPLVLFVFSGSSSLGGAVEDGRPLFTSLSESETCVRSTPASGAGGPRDATCFAFALAKAVAVRAFVAACFSAFSFAAKSFCAITAAVNPAASANPWVFFFFQVLLGIASGIPIGRCARAS